MASAGDIKKKIADVKARPLILIVGGVVLLAGILIFFGLRRNSSAAAAESLTSKAAPVPAIRSTPGVGNTQDKTYNQLQLEQNKLRAQQAEQTGGSAVPTLINQAALMGGDSSIASLEGSGPDGGPNSAAAQQQEAYRKLLEEQNRLSAERAAAQRKGAAGAEQVAQQAQQAYEALMQKQANELMKRWQPIAQAVVGGQVLPASTTAQMQSVSGSNAAASSSSAAKTPALYKAGDIVFGILETGVNSDVPGPIMARIVSGPLKGSKLIGTIQRQNDKVMLNFNVLNAEALPNSISVSIVAIDPETARTALASDVDNHYLLKYGAVFAGAFLQGVSQAVQSSLQPSLTSSNNTLTATSTTATTSQQIKVGLGQVGQEISQNIQQYSPQPTVTVDAGTSIGLLFLSDFTLAADSNLTNSANKPTTLNQTLSTLPAGTSTSANSASNSGGTPQPVTTTTTTSTGPLPGTIGPRSQTQQTTVTSVQPTGH